MPGNRRPVKDMLRLATWFATAVYAIRRRSFDSREGFFGVDPVQLFRRSGHDGAAFVLMAQEVMTASDSDNDKIHLNQGINQFRASDPLRLMRRQ
jgi:hypothetical protein